MAVSLQSAVPAPASDIKSQSSALLTSTAVASLDDTGWIRVTGNDRVRWLNGMVSNFVQQLAPGEGCYNFVLNAQGRILGDLTAFAEPASFLLETSREQLPALVAHLDRFIIMDDVELADLSEQRRGILLAGPQATSILQTLGLATPPDLHLQAATWNGASIEAVHAHSPVVPRFELWSDQDTLQQLVQRVTAAGATPVSAEALERLRILEGTPLYGTDIRNSETAKDLPQETAQTRALHFSKGCYLGQEIVARMHARQQVAKQIVGWKLENDALPMAGAKLFDDKGNEIGGVTSSTLSPILSDVAIGLGYVKRPFIAAGTKIRVPAEGAVREATVSELPFVKPTAE